jgi:hypothetical protein
MPTGWGRYAYDGAGYAGTLSRTARLVDALQAFDAKCLTVTLHQHVELLIADAQLVQAVSPTSAWPETQHATVPGLERSQVGDTAALESHNAEIEAGIEIRQIKYLNNIVEQDHRAIKVGPILGSKSFRSAAATPAGSSSCT